VGVPQESAKGVLREGAVEMLRWMWNKVLAVNRVLQSQLVGVSPFDPLVLVAAPAMLVVVAAAACRIPVRRALRIDPALALRHE
jgi:hypothetical protein